MTWKVKIEKHFHNLAYWAVPPGFSSALRNLYFALQSKHPPSAMQPIFTRNGQFHNIHTGKRCFILATGPSINKQDLRRLKNEICIAVYGFFFHKDIKDISPLYHVEAPNHPPYGWEVPQSCFEGYRDYYSEKTTIFLGHTPYEYSSINFLQQNPGFKSDNIYFLDYTASPALDERNYNCPDIWDITKSLFACRTVVYCAIQIAVYMGFTEIYLLGCDHDYLSYHSRGRSAHFYSDDQGIDDSSVWRSTEDEFLSYHILWKQYRLMQEYLNTKGCYIYNATEGGLLDVFPKVTLVQALGFPFNNFS
jgi:Protein of unknown function DUF115